MNAPPTPRPRREGLLLTLLLVGLQTALLFLGSGRGMLLFSAPRAIADLDSLAPDLPRADDGSIVLAAAPGQSIARLAGFAPEPGRSYLIRVRAGAGLPFTLQMIDDDAERATRNWEVPARGETAELVLAIDDWALAAKNRLEIRNPTPGDLTVHELEIRRLRRLHGVVTRTIRPLALGLLLVFAWRHRGALRAYLGSGRHRAPLDGLVAGLFLVICFHVFLDAPVNQLLDGKYSTVVSHQLLTRGDLSLPEDFAPALAERRPYQLQSVGDRIYHLYPDAVAVLNAPLVAVFDWLGLPPVAANGLFLRHNELTILVFAAAVQSAALCALLFLLGRLYLPPAPALALAAVFAFGTQISSSVSRPYWSHAWGLLLLTAGLYLLLAPATRERWWAHAAAATCLSWSFFCRPPIALAIVGLTVYLVVTRRRHLPVFAATGALWAALFAAYSLHNFGQPIPPYFLTTHLKTGVLGIETMRVSYPTAAVGTLVSASRGLFVFVPFLLAILWLVVRHWRSLGDRALAGTGLGVCVAHWQLLSSNRWWDGGQCYGPRLFADVLVWFLLLAALTLPLEVRRLRRQRRVVAAAKVALALVLVAVSLFINIRGANARATFTWQGSHWDWSNPQFLAGLLPEPRIAPLGERLAALRSERNELERSRVLQEIVAGESVARRWVEPERMLAAFVTWDNWTYGDAPAALVVVNPTEVAFAPRLGLATWAGADVYPITVRIEDGTTTAIHRLTARGKVEVDLDPVPPRSRRLYIVWSDRAWTPGESDSRSLGVQLLPPG